MPGLHIDKVGGGGSPSNFDQDNKNIFIDLPEEAFVERTPHSIAEYVNSIFPVIEIGEKEIPYFRLKSGIFKPFITEWEILAESPSLTLPVTGWQEAPVEEANYKFIVDWGDGSPLQEVTSETIIKATHLYFDPGTYQIKIYGICPVFRFNSLIDRFDENATRTKLKKIIQWGDVRFTGIDFNWCENLNEVVDTTPGNFFFCQRLDNLFYWCYNLTSVPDDIFKNSPNTEFFNNIFVDTQLRVIPNHLFENCIAAKEFNATFNGIDAFTEIPPELFRFNINATSFKSTFSTNGLFLKNIPAGLFDYNVNATDFEAVFDRNDLLAIPPNLFSKNVLATNFDRAFFNNPNLSGPAPELWTIPGSTGDKCFYGNVNLDNYDVIPDNWKNQF